MSKEANDTIVKNAIIAFERSYTHKNIKKAFLYRIEDKDRITVEELEKLSKRQNDGDNADLQFLKTIMGKLKNEIDLLRKISEALQAIDIDNEQSNQLKQIKKEKKEILIKSLIDMNKNVSVNMQTEIIEGFIEVINENIDAEISEDMGTLLEQINDNRATSIAEKVMSKFPDDQPKDGMWYELVNQEHRWAYNLCWMFGHFMKGTDTFIIAHDPNQTELIFSEENMYSRLNSTKSPGRFGSGFAREISCCYQNGYKLKLNEDNCLIFYRDNSYQEFGLNNVPELIFDPLHQEGEEEKIFKNFCKAMKDYHAIIVNILHEAEKNFKDKGAKNAICTNLIEEYLYGPIPKEINRNKEKKKQPQSSIAIQVSSKQFLWDKIKKEALEIVKNSSPSKTKSSIL